MLEALQKAWDLFDKREKLAVNELRFGGAWQADLENPLDLPAQRIGELRTFLAGMKVPTVRIDYINVIGGDFRDILKVRIAG